MNPKIRKNPFTRPRPLFVTCDAGLIELLVAELGELGLEEIEAFSRGARVQATREQMWRINIESRLAHRVLMPLVEFPAPDEEALYKGARRIDWSSWMRNTQTISVDTTEVNSAFDNTMFVNQRVKDAICDFFVDETGRRPSVDRQRPDVRINVHLEGEHCVISLDSSGERLYRRGYRRERGEAPLRETLAAAMIKASGWTPDRPLLDPLCGSGTLLIEAALIARDVAPGLVRLRNGLDFGFMRWVGHDRVQFDRLLETLRARIKAPHEVWLPTPAPSVVPEIAPSAKVASQTLDREDESLDEAEGSFDDSLSGTDDSLDDAEDSLDDAEGSLDDADDSLEDADDSLEDAEGSPEDAEGSLEDAGDALNPMTGWMTGLDRDPQVIEIAHRNARRAGVRLDLRVGDVLEATPLEARPGGVIISNPPYGHRLRPEGLLRLYEDLGAHLNARFMGYKAVLLVAEDAPDLGFEARARMSVFNGPIPCQILQIDLPAARQPARAARVSGGDRPFRRREARAGGDRPFKRRDDRGEGRPQRDNRDERPFQRRDDRGEGRPQRDNRDERPFQRRDERAEGRPQRDNRGDRPAPRRDDRAEGRPQRDNRDERPFQRRDDRSEGRPQRDNRDERPFQRRDDRAEGRPQRDNRDERPFQRRDDRGEGRPQRDNRGDRPAPRRDDRPEGRPQRDNRDERPFQRRDDR
ncbi:hypothetical protein KKB55_22275, partial [Myxococcota bacterium]|nr:hypothetical protein [Myxococcota bacterium]